MKQDKVILENSKAIEPLINGEITYNNSLNKFRKKENGVVSDAFPPSGNNKAVQYNNAGDNAGAANVEIELGNLALVETTDPTPIAGKAIIYPKNIAGRTLPRWTTQGSISTPFQSGIFFNRVSLIYGGGGTTISVLGCTVSNVGAISNPVITSTNIKTQTRRFTNSSTATAGALASTRITNLECWRGNAVNMGGFFVVCRFGLTTLQAGMRAFFGLSSTATTAPTNVDPTTSTTAAVIAMAINSNTGNWKLINNTAGTAPTVLDLGTNFSVNNTDMIEMILFAKPNDTVVGYNIKNLQTNNEVSGTIISNLPASTTFLGRLMWATNNATAASVSWDCSRFGLETNY